MKRPTGLTILAIVNFIYATGRSVGILLMMTGIGLPAEYDAASTHYDYFFSTISIVLLVVGGLGFLKMNYYLGFIVGLVFAIFEAVAFLMYNVMDISGIGLERPWVYLAYPAVLTYVLIFRFREAFRRSAEPTPPCDAATRAAQEE